MSQLRPATDEEIAGWDALVADNPDGGHWLQGKTWAQFRADRGYVPRYFIYTQGKLRIAALALERKVSGYGPFWYFSKGPGVTSLAEFESFTESLRQTRPEAFFARFEPPVLIVSAKAPELAKIGLKSSRQQILKATIVVDISVDEDAVIASFKQKTRYNIRLAARKGVTVEPVEATPENLGRMYELMQATQKRAGYFLHTREYFLDLWARLAAAKQGQLFFASYDGQLLAGVFAVYLGQKAWYKDGGSIRERSEVMAPYLLQWEVMRWLKGRGVESYDLVGVAPRAQAGHHIMDSLEHFKAGFSQNVVEWIGTYDLPLSPRYAIWKGGGERLAVAYHARIKKEFLY